MVMKEDRLYITKNVLNQACADKSLGYTDPLKLLFFSMCINKKFSIPISWATSESLSSIDDRNKSVLRDTYLGASVEEDCYTQKKFPDKIDENMSLVFIIPFRAGECSGKIKIIVLDEEVEDLKYFYSKFNLPAEVVGCSQIAQEIKEFHDNLIAEAEN